MSIKVTLYTSLSSLILTKQEMKLVALPQGTSYCTCEAGARTVRCCSHIMYIVWYLSCGHDHDFVVVTENENLNNVTIPISNN